MATFYVHDWAVTLRPRQEEGAGLEEAQVSPAGNTQGIQVLLTLTWPLLNPVSYPFLVALE